MQPCNPLQPPPPPDEVRAFSAQGSSDRPQQPLALGFLLNSPQFPIGPGQNSFGQSGMGGAMGFCDPDRGLALGYVMNKMHAVSNIGPRIIRLIEAVYACL